jgi:membrane-bound lytic murein transglycosylase MltF
MGLSFWLKVCALCDFQGIISVADGHFIRSRHFDASCHHLELIYIFRKFFGWKLKEGHMTLITRYLRFIIHFAVPAFFLAILSPLAANCAEENIKNSPVEVVEEKTLAELPAALTATEEAEIDEMVLPIPHNMVGDFDAMRKRNLVRILVPSSKTYYFFDRAQQAGIDYEFGKALEQWLNKKHPTQTKSQPWRVMYIPVRRDQLLTELLAGKGDFAGGGLTVTEGRKQTVDFPAPFASGVREAVVTGPTSGKFEKLKDLAGQEVMVRASSSYFEHLTEINVSFKKQGLAPIKIVAADEWLESEDLLEMVNAGLIKATVVDRYLAAIWQPLYTEIKINDSFYIHATGDLAWAIRKGSPKLHSILKAFMKEHKVGTTFGNVIARRYAYDKKRVLNATSEEEMQKFRKLVDIFEKHGKNYEFDHIMLTAQGFQESRLNQNERSPRGAVGVMQLLPSTAADPAVNITGIDKDADRNIEAGAKYLRLLIDKYLDEPELTPINRTLMAFAAYNAGPGNLRKFRSLAKKSGKDPNIWFQNVEVAAGRIVGQETVTYVSNIYKYYLAYKMSLENKKAEADKANSKSST